MTLPSKPLPASFILDELDQPFWDAAAKHQLVIHQCQACKISYWPASVCREHGDKHMQWVPASGRGVVYTYTVFHRPFLKEWQRDVPYNVAVIELAEGPLVFSNIVGVPNDEIRCGMAVEVLFEDVQPGVSIPKFRPLGR